MYISLLKNNLTTVGDFQLSDEECILSVPMTEEYDPAYRYQLLPNGNIIKTPIPEPEAVAESNPIEDLDAMAVDHEYRLALLELGLNESEVK